MASLMSHEVVIRESQKPPTEFKKDILDRGVLFMKRLEDDGCIVHMSVKDREMIDLFRAKDDDYRKHNDSENISEHKG